MVTSPEGDGAILLGTYCQHPFSFNKLFLFKPLSNGTFEWVNLDISLKYKRWTPILAYIDDDKVNCYPKTPTQDPTTTTATTTDVPTTTSINPRKGKSEQTFF